MRTRCVIGFRHDYLPRRFPRRIGFLQRRFADARACPRFCLSLIEQANQSRRGWIGFRRPRRELRSDPRSRGNIPHLICLIPQKRSNTFALMGRLILKLFSPPMGRWANPDCELHSSLTERGFASTACRFAGASSTPPAGEIGNVRDPPMIGSEQGDRGTLTLEELWAGITKLATVEFPQRLHRRAAIPIGFAEREPSHWRATKSRQSSRIRPLNLGRRTRELHRVGCRH